MVEIRELDDNPEQMFPTAIITRPTFNDDDDEATSSGDDSDRELQVAFERGYLKPGLNVVKTVIKKKWINNVSGLKSKLSDLKKDFDWIERLDVAVERPVDTEESAEVENDFKREVSFIKQAQAAVAEALPRLHKLRIVTKRPDDYFAEMFKSDDHMKKVRAKLLNFQVSKQKTEAARRFREERKFAVRIQKDVALERQRDKKLLSDAVKKHKKGIKDQFEKIIGENGESDQKRTHRKRALKDAKYGHGGRKKRAKWNTAQSSADVASFNSSIFSRQRSGSGNGSGKKPSKNRKQRPGKARRAKSKNNKR